MLIAVGFAFGVACFGMATAHNTLLLYVAFASLRALGQGSLNINTDGQPMVRLLLRPGSRFHGLGLGLVHGYIPPSGQSPHR